MVCIILRFVLLTIFTCFLVAADIFAQATGKDTLIRELNEIVVSASKFPEKKRNIIQKIDLVSSQFISRTNAQNTGDLLMSTGNVFVQKSQQGGSSPVIRGFEASRVLLVVDGIRMNNLIYRSGHLQNVITVDQNMLEGLEIIYGPASTQYGSDALGGAVHFRTKQPALATDSIRPLIKGNYFTRFSSINNEKTIHADLNLGNTKWSWLQSYTFSDFGDMRMGALSNGAYPEFGKRDSLIATINGIDSVIKNRDPLVQKFSGYKQWDILQKILFKPSKKISHLLNLQFSNSTNVPRYDRLQDKRDFGGNTGKTLRWAEWYYGPQKRLLSAYEMNVRKILGFDQINLNINYQAIEESRYQREYRRYDRLDGRKENVQVAGWIVDGRIIRKNHEWTIGADGQWNAVKSTASRKNILTGEKSSLDTRYPNGINEQWNAALYFQHIYKINKRLIVNDGVRMQINSLLSTIEDNRFFNLPYRKISQVHRSVTGNIGLIFLPNPGFKMSVSLSGGFRAPNADDLAKIFESNTERQQLVVPNPGIRPERTYNAEFNLIKSFNQKVVLNAGIYYTRFTDALVKSPFPFLGKDSFLYNGIMSQTLANVNANEAYLYGYNVEVRWTISKCFSANSTLNFTEGRFFTDAEKLTEVYQRKSDGTGYELVKKSVSTKPLDHIPPVFGKINLSYHQQKLRAELNFFWNGAKTLDNYNPDGEDNAQYATPVGSIAWQTINLSVGWTINPNWIIQAGVDNIMDLRYRLFASGISAPGRNFVATLRFSH